MPEQTESLKLMRKPFEPHQISKMCKSTKKDNAPGRCRDCGGFHKLPSVQLSYVGHAALTDRLLDADPTWTWEPLSYAPDGSPLLDTNGGLWIKLTVAGVTRLGYGDAQGKVGGDAMKERIGDALRNAGMRFGAALDLWHKGDLHPEIAIEEETGKFDKQPDGSFKKNTENVQNAPNLPNVVTGFTLGPNPIIEVPNSGKIAKPVARKKEKVADAGKPWGGEFEPKNTPKSPEPGPNAITSENPITDADVLFPGDPEPKPEPARLPFDKDPAKPADRMCTDEEAKGFRERLIKVKDKGFAGLGQWILKTSGKPRTQDIPYAEISKMVDKVEAAEKAGTLKALLG